MRRGRVRHRSDGQSAVTAQPYGPDRSSRMLLLLLLLVVIRLFRRKRDGVTGALRGRKLYGELVDDGYCGCCLGGDGDVFRGGGGGGGAVSVAQIATGDLHVLPAVTAAFVVTDHLQAPPDGRGTNGWRRTGGGVGGSGGDGGGGVGVER